MLGRNPAYIQQFVRRGVPKRLKEDERRKLARYFAVSEAILGGPPDEAAGRLTAWSASSATRSAFRPGREHRRGGARKGLFRIRRALAENADSTPAGELSIVRVEGDSMAPTSNTATTSWSISAMAVERLRDGIYVLRVDDALVVKRARAPPDAAAGDGSVGQSRLSRLARLQPRRDQLHRPGDLGRTADGLIGAPAVDQPGRDREQRRRRRSRSGRPSADCGSQGRRGIPGG